ncbi:MAG: UvrB/UvrC motif-containing protein [Streptosporangiaceae bacterium]|jgi:ATP-dependent Clp protease ATP-binding subunit ClpC
MPAEFVSRLRSVESRLSAVERRVGTGPDQGEIGRRIGQVRREKEAAIDVQDFERAAALRDSERQLLAEKAASQEEWAATHADLPALGEQIKELASEVERLRGLLRERGIDPQDGVA